MTQLKPASAVEIRRRHGLARIRSISARFIDVRSITNPLGSIQHGRQFETRPITEKLQRRPRPLQRLVEQELDAEDLCAERTTGHRLRLHEIGEIVTQVLFRKLIGRTMEVSGQSADRVDINLCVPGANPCRFMSAIMRRRNSVMASLPWQENGRLPPTGSRYQRD